jgi:hypothetical protein
VWLCKGFEEGSGALGHEVSRQVRPGRPCGVLSGPSFALEVARGQPTALVAASEDAALVATTVQAFHSESLRVYASSDIVGVEVGGAVKNVLAIATGILDGMAAGGLNARAALITRGLAEMTRLGLALGARAETFMGLSGLGDLVLTATGDLSRNRRVGLLLAAGQPLASGIGHAGPCGRRRARCGHGAGARAGPGRGHADHRGRGAGAARPGGAGPGTVALDGLAPRGCRAPRRPLVAEGCRRPGACSQPAGCGGYSPPS